MKLTEDEVFQILKFLEESRFDELNLEMGDLKLHVRKSGRPGGTGGECVAITSHSNGGLAETGGSSKQGTRNSIHRCGCS